MLFFVLLAARNLSASSVIKAGWYLILVACLVILFTEETIVIRKDERILFLTLFISGVVNHFVVGNAMLSDLVFLVLFFGVYRVLDSEFVDEKYILIALYINCVFIAFFLLIKGLGNPVFKELSNNFVSVILLMPAIVYYTKAERHQKPVVLMPAIATFLTSLLALGRGGMLTTAIFLMLIMLYSVTDESAMGMKKKSYLRIVVMLGGVFFLVGIGFFWSVIMQIPVFERFATYGMYGTGRIGIWTEYLTGSAKSISNAILGVPFSELPLMVRYRNNLHNSLFNVHALFGLPALCCICYYYFHNFKICLDNRRWIYIISLTAFLLRALTDKVFGGGAVATPLLFFLLLSIRVEDKQCLNMGDGRDQCHE